MQGLMRGIPGDERVHIQVGSKRLECRVIGDKWWFDQETIQSTDTQKDFFLSTTGKTPNQYEFEGDKSLVKEEEYALIYAMVAWPLSVVAAPTSHALADLYALFHTASYEWKQNNVVVGEDNMLSIAGGIREQAFVEGPAAAPALTHALGDGRHDNVRKLVKPILVTGGRSVDFRVSFTSATSADDTIALMIRLWGLHLIPTKVVPAREEVEKAPARPARR